MTQQRNALLPDFDFEMNKNHTAKKCILRYRFWNKSKSQECFIPLNFCFLVPVVLEGSMIPKWGKNCWNICPAPILGSVQGQAGAPWAVEAAPAMAGPKSLHGFGITRGCRDQHRNCLQCATAAPPCPWKVFSKEFRTTDPVSTGVPDPQPTLPLEEFFHGILRILPPQVVQTQPHGALNWEAAGREFHGILPMEEERDWHWD